MCDIINTKLTAMRRGGIEVLVGPGTPTAGSMTTAEETFCSLKDIFRGFWYEFVFAVALLFHLRHIRNMCV
jgi:hypothetical protein